MFWAATPHEFWAAVDGWAELNVPGRPGAPLDDEEIAVLEDMKRRFPDQARPRAPNSRAP